ncbi:MAG: hypothetical protein LC104_04550 [Bacteroidales bacterium]|nr:hypothetical protein [Bacteroidales bacterium]
MTFQIVVEPRDNGGYVARAGSPFDWCVEAATADEAVAMLRDRAARAQVISLDVPVGTNPVAAVAGIAQGAEQHPLWAEWRKCMEENRLRDDQPAE